jgi:hypothetical protein
MSAQVATALLLHCNDRQLVMILFIFATFAKPRLLQRKKWTSAKNRATLSQFLPNSITFLIFTQEFNLSDSLQNIQKTTLKCVFAWETSLSTGLIHMYFIRMVNTTATSNILKQYWSWDTSLQLAWLFYIQASLKYTWAYSALCM